MSSKKRKKSPKKVDHRSNSFFFFFVVFSTLLMGLIWVAYSVFITKPIPKIDTAGWTTYSNKEAGYSLKIPQNYWYRNIEVSLFPKDEQKTLVSYTSFSTVYKTQPDFAKGYLETPHGDPLLDVRKTQGKTLDQITDDSIKAFTAGGINYKIKKKESTTVAGVDARRVVTDTEFADPKPSYFYYFFVKDGNWYSYMYQSPNEAPLSIPETIISTFTFTK